MQQNTTGVSSTREADPVRNGDECRCADSLSFSSALPSRRRSQPLLTYLLTTRGFQSDEGCDLQLASTTDAARVSSFVVVWKNRRLELELAVDMSADLNHLNFEYSVFYSMLRDLRFVQMTRR